MARLHAEVVPVGQSVPLPVVSHNGTQYVVAKPGAEWHLRVKILHAAPQQLYRARVKLDGRELDYAKRLQHSSSSNSCERDFEGFAYTEPSSGYVYYKAFKFAALQPTAGAATVEHPDQIQAGRIEVTCVAVVQHSDSHRSYHHGDRKWCTDAADKKLPEGKKWFLQPGLQAAEGSSTVRTNKHRTHRRYTVLHTLPPLKLRYDTADNLRLRKILDPSKPQHAAALASAGGAAGSSSGAGSSRQVKQERRTAGVKRERGADQQQQEAVPRSATAETINLVDAAPAPLRVGGRALAADELAVCDLAGSDDEGEPAWQVHKKPALEVEVEV